jgi:tripartite-type tricarboxylate transporter receptor subunit TctC
VRSLFSVLVRFAGAVALTAAAASGALAQDRYPSQVIKIVVPYAPGGTTDQIARYYAERLGKELGQPVIVDNKPGGGTNIGAEAVARARPDGYTLLFANNAQVLNPVFGPTPAFELGALDPVSLTARVAFVLAANPKLAVNNPAELIAAAKASPGKLTVSSAQLDFYVALLNMRAGINLLHIPYKGGAPAALDAISGQVDMVFALTPVLLSQIQGGKLKAVVVSAEKRLAVLPDTPTFKESGIDYDLTTWYGLMTPAGTPKAIVDRLAAVTQKIMGMPDMVEKVRAAGAEPAWNKPQEFATMLKSESAMWQQIAKAQPSLVQK